MEETEARTTIQAFVGAMNAHDLAALATLYTDDVVLEWPQSGERIRGEANRRAVYDRFPALPTITATRVSGSGGHWVLEAGLDYGDGKPYLGVFVLELRDGRIARSITYWSEPFPAPPWRAPWVERFEPGT
jgi:ketosteroid isomerase-like protein